MNFQREEDDVIKMTSDGKTASLVRVTGDFYESECWGKKYDGFYEI